MNAILVIKIQETYAQNLFAIVRKYSVPEYLETDKEKNAGRTPLLAAFSKLEMLLKMFPPFPEKQNGERFCSKRSVQAFDEVFCGLSNEERKRCVAFWETSTCAYSCSVCQRDADIIRESAQADKP